MKGGGAGRPCSGPCDAVAKRVENVINAVLLVAALSLPRFGGTAQPWLNGATIRLDGGRDAALATETRAEGD